MIEKNTYGDFDIVILEDESSVDDSEFGRHTIYFSIHVRSSSSLSVPLDYVGWWRDSIVAWMDGWMFDTYANRCNKRRVQWRANWICLFDGFSLLASRKSHIFLEKVKSAKGAEREDWFESSKSKSIFLICEGTMMRAFANSKSSDKYEYIIIIMWFIYSWA